MHVCVCVSIVVIVAGVIVVVWWLPKKDDTDQIFDLFPKFLRTTNNRDVQDTYSNKQKTMDKQLLVPAMHTFMLHNANANANAIAIAFVMYR